MRAPGDLRAVVVALAIACLVGCVPALPQAFDAPLPPPSDHARLVVVGDLQRTSWLELWRESNDRERALVVDAVAASRADLVAVTGDFVFDGGSEARWEELDVLMQPVRAARLPVVAAFGNHEYWEGRSLGEEHFFRRIVHAARRHWYAVALGSLRLVVLDSNIDRLFPLEWRAQVAWLEASLDAFDHDPAVRGVVVMMHHPPYTNSTVTGDEAHVQVHFVPPFARAKKTLAMLSGHVHSYERFVAYGKTFVVSGGGGGPRAKLLTGDARRHTGDLFAGPALRDFHFTIYDVSERGIDAEVRGLPKGGDVFRTMDRFALPYR